MRVRLKYVVQHNRGKRSIPAVWFRLDKMCSKVGVDVFFVL